MRELLAVMAYLYVFVMYLAYFGLRDDAGTIFYDFIRTTKFMFSRKCILMTFVVGLPVYVISHWSIFLASVIALVWLYNWVKKVRNFTYD